MVDALNRRYFSHGRGSFPASLDPTVAAAADDVAGGEGCPAALCPNKGPGPVLNAANSNLKVL